MADQDKNKARLERLLESRDNKELFGNLHGVKLRMIPVADLSSQNFRFERDIDGNKLLTVEAEPERLYIYEGGLVYNVFDLSKLSLEEAEEAKPAENVVKNEFKHILMPQSQTYALGVQALRDAYDRGEAGAHPTFTQTDGRKIARQLTFKENVEALVNSYKTDGKEDNLRLFKRWIDSSTGSAFKRRSTKFKLIPECEQLIAIDSGFNGFYLPVDYDSLTEGIELDSSQGIYNRQLTKHQTLEHKAGITALREDRHLLKEFTSIVYSLRKDQPSMGFFVRQNENEDRLRGLCIVRLDIGSGASGNNDLDDSGSFLLVAQ